MTDEISVRKLVSFLRVGKRRLEIFTKACHKFGLTIVDHTTPDSLILIDDELDFISAQKLIKNSSLTSPAIFIRTQWLSDSIKQNQLLPYQSYVLHATPSPSITESPQIVNKTDILKEPPPSALKRERSISTSASDTDDEPNSKKVIDNNLLVVLRFSLFSVMLMFNQFNQVNYHERYENLLMNLAGRTKIFQAGIWLCSEASSATPVVGNPNEKIIEKLRVRRTRSRSPGYLLLDSFFKEMSKLYLITNDKGRSIAYQKAIEALKRCTHPIRTYEVIEHQFRQISFLFFCRKSKLYLT